MLRDLSRRVPVLATLGLAAIMSLTSTASATVTPELDGNEDFAQLSRKGFEETVNGNYPDLETNPDGSFRNSYTWSMEWFQGKLYIGVIRDVFCFVSDPALTPEECPDSSGGFPLPGPEQRAEIWQYDPSVSNGGIDGSWSRVYQSPYLTGFLSLFLGAEVARDVGYRGMAVCDAGDDVERLYIATIGIPGLILYTEDGETFQEASRIGLEAPGNDLASVLLNYLNFDFDLGYRSLSCFKDRLWTSPVGRLDDTDLARPGRTLMLANADPSSSSSPWVETNLPGFDGPDNLSVFDIGTFDVEPDGAADYIFAGTFNRTTGAEIWKTDGEPGSDCDAGTGLCTWTKVLDEGAARPTQSGALLDNGGVNSFGQHGDYLYAGLADAASSEPAMSELIRIDSSDNWELVMGEVRPPAAQPNFTCTPSPGPPFFPPGVCVPLSGLGPGWAGDAPTLGGAIYTWRLTSHDDGSGSRLFAGTLQFGPYPVLVPFPPFFLFFNLPGFDLIASADGVSWEWVSDDGLGNTSNGGLRSLKSTDIGLFVGGTNSGQGIEIFLGTTEPEFPPTAIAGPDEHLVDVSGTVIADLDGSASFDSFGGEITSYEWFDGDGAAGCAVGGLTQINPGTETSPVTNPALLPGDPLVGTVLSATFTLRVEDDRVGTPDEDCDAVTVTASSNTPPSVHLETDPPAIGGSLTLVDFDGDGEEVFGLSGQCSDADSGGAQPRCEKPIQDGLSFVDSTVLPSTVTDFESEILFDEGTLGADMSPAVGVVAFDGIVCPTGAELYCPLFTASEEIEVSLVPVTDTPENDPPVCQGVRLRTIVDDPVSFDPVDPDSRLCKDPDDADGILTYAVGSNGPGGGATVTGSITYTPATSFSGEDDFTFVAGDDEAASSNEALVRVSVFNCYAVSAVEDFEVADASITGAGEIRDACFTVTATTGVTEITSGDTTFSAAEGVILGNGFSVASGATFTAEIDPSLLCLGSGCP